MGFSPLHNTLGCWQCGMGRSNAAAACGRTPHAALLCGSIHAHFAAFNAVPRKISERRLLFRQTTTISFLVCVFLIDTTFWLVVTPHAACRIANLVHTRYINT
jgi:hypothetical protein